MRRDKPWALDLCCCAGGASEGLRRAGFNVIGVDLEPQPNYTGGEFVQADALTYGDLEDFDFVWASPHCQAFTAYKRRPGHVGQYPNQIAAFRARLAPLNIPWVIENVPGAPLIDPVTLCGSMFGLDVRRHRCFEASFPIEAPPCRHDLQKPRFPPATNRKNKRSTVEVGVWRIPLDVQRRAMGIDWMTREELSQAIPPAYAEFIGRAAMEQIKRAA